MRRRDARFADGSTRAGRPPSARRHPLLRKRLFPWTGRAIGVNMWRGGTRWPPYLGGATMVRAGWLATGKMVLYPIRTHADGTQLVNWVFEIETPQYQQWDWNRKARVEDFFAHVAGWRFGWLDIPAMLRAAELVLEYPMVDKDPLARWTHGRVTLLGTRPSYGPARLERGGAGDRRCACWPRAGGSLQRRSPPTGETPGAQTWCWRIGAARPMPSCAGIRAHGTSPSGRWTK
jgi:hypothetical protein